MCLNKATREAYVTDISIPIGPDFTKSMTKTSKCTQWSPEIQSMWKLNSLNSSSKNDNIGEHKTSRYSIISIICNIYGNVEFSLLQHLQQYTYFLYVLT